MLLRQEKLIPENHPVRNVLAERGWDEFTVCSLEPAYGPYFDKNFTILAFEGAIAKLGITTGFACFEIPVQEMAPEREAHTFFLMVA